MGSILEKIVDPNSGEDSEWGFQCIGRDGIGNPRSQLAQSMVYFNDCLYLGMTHHHGHGPEDCARILRYDYEDDSWELAYESPLVDADERAFAPDTMFDNTSNLVENVEEQVPLYRGFRSLAIFQGPTDDAPAIYVGSISNWGAQILRSSDGESFEPVGERGFGNDTLMSFRSLQPFQNRLYCAATGYTDGETVDRNLKGDPTVYVSDDPAAGVWVPAVENAFGDPDNIAITRLAEFDNHLYASVTNAQSGFQIWKTDGKGKPPFKWTLVVDSGASRYVVSELAPTMVPFKGALYVSSGIPGAGDKINDIDAGPAELLRIYPDDSWELIAGTPRFTPQGLKIPYSLMGAEFGDRFNTVIWSMAEHNGLLFAGTHHLRGLCMRDMSGLGGFHLWVSENGDDWEPITIDGFGDRWQYGCRSLLSTPHGLFLGTGNCYSDIRKRLMERMGRHELKEPTKGAQVWLL